MSSSELSKAQKSQRVVLPVVIILAGHVIATQRFAHLLKYNESILGAPAMVDPQLQISLYYPWQYYQWGARFWQDYQEIVINLGLSIPASLVLAVAVLAVLIFKKGIALEEDAHGSAHWETMAGLKKREIYRTPQERLAEIKKHNLVVNKAIKKNDHKNIRSFRKRNEMTGVMLGKDPLGERFLYDYHDSHAIVVAPTGAGKGVGLVIPTLLTWQGSALVIDIKGENYQKTSVMRRRQGEVIYFNPTRKGSARFNPLLELRKERIVSDLQQLAMDINSGSKAELHWKAGSERVLQVVMAHVLCTETEHKHLGRCTSLLSGGEEFLKTLKTKEYSDPVLRAFIHEETATILSGNDRERGSWITGAQNALRLWKDPLIQEVTSESDFSLQQFQFHTSRPTTLYLVVPPQEIERLSPLLRLIINQLLAVTTEDNTAPGRDHRLLMLLDEFPRLGKLPRIKDALTYTRSYGMKFFLITQSIQRLDELYGREQDFISSCHMRVFTAPNDEYNAKAISTLAGKTTRLKSQVSRARSGKLLGSSGKKNVSEVQYARDLITPEEALALPKDELLIFEANYPPIKAKKIYYYSDDFLKRCYRDDNTMPARKNSIPKGVTLYWNTHTPDPELATHHVRATSKKDAKLNHKDNKERVVLQNQDNSSITSNSHNEGSQGDPPTPVQKSEEVDTTEACTPTSLNSEPCNVRRQEEADNSGASHTEPKPSVENHCLDTSDQISPVIDSYKVKFYDSFKDVLPPQDKQDTLDIRKKMTISEMYAYIGIPVDPATQPGNELVSIDVVQPMDRSNEVEPDTGAQKETEDDEDDDNDSTYCGHTSIVSLSIVV